MSDPLVLILAAGESRRFLEQGIRTPKALLTLEYMGHEGSMLSFIQSGIPEQYDALTVLQSGHEAPNDIRGDVIHIAPTRGQAETVYRVLSTMREDRPILVHDCDMMLDVLDNHKLIDLLENYQLSVAVTETFDPNASRVDSVPFPDVFVEKQNISKWGIVGARAFESSLDLLQAIEIELRANINTVDYEPYLSQAMNNFMGQAFAHVITDFVDWGTPERIVASGARIIGGVR